LLLFGQLNAAFPLQPCALFEFIPLMKTPPQSVPAPKSDLEFFCQKLNCIPSGEAGNKMKEFPCFGFGQE
jgi:hypothetical protein